MCRCLATGLDRCAGLHEGRHAKLRDLQGNNEVMCLATGLNRCVGLCEGKYVVRFSQVLRQCGGKFLVTLLKWYVGLCGGRHAAVWVIRRKVTGVWLQG